MTAKQVERVMGALKSPKDLRDYKLKKSVCMAVQYPDSFECDDTVKVKDQGNVGSCVAHTVSEIMEFHEGGTKNNYPKLSTNFVYGIHHKLFGSNGPGMYPREACKILIQYGDPTEELCPGNTEVDRVYSIAETAVKSDAVITSAAQHKISSYALMTSADDIKYALMNYGPVLGAIRWFSDNTLQDKFILQKGKIYAGGHAIMIRGWNETGWICQNSWGSYWGKKGMFCLPFNYGITESYSLIPASNDDDIVKPVTCPITSIFYKIANFFINLFNK